jgi:hypothetical protein
MKLASLVEDIFRKHRYATSDDVRDAFGDYHNVLHWLTNFLVGDNGAQGVYIVDAAGLSDTPTPDFHDWLVQWAARATVRNVLQSERKRIRELAKDHERKPALHRNHPPLAVEHFRALINHSEEIRSRVDLLCRFVLLIRGIAKESIDEVAAQLGISRTAVEHAYCVAFDILSSEE